jgi:arylamine N-acetyltransferase
MDLDSQYLEKYFTRIKYDGPAIALFARATGTNWRQHWAMPGPLYRFALETQTLVDYEVYHWFVSTAPKSRFIQNLTLGAAGVRSAADDTQRQIHTRHRDGRVEARTLGRVDGLRQNDSGAFLK